MCKEQVLRYGSYVASYLFGVVIAHYPIRRVVDLMWERIGWAGEYKETVRPASWQSRIIGCVERTLYVAAFHVNQAEFIAVWLAVKVAVQWKRWEEGREYGERTIAGRAIYNIFLIGSALSVAYALVGAKLVEWVSERQWVTVVAVPLLLLLATLCLFRWTIHLSKAESQ